MDVLPADVHHPALWRIATAAQQLHQPTADDLCAHCTTAYPCPAREAADQVVLASFDDATARCAHSEDHEVTMLRLLLKSGLSGPAPVGIGSAA